MPYLIGTDEAGYGPNLGPLVISASVWWIDEEHWQKDLYQQLESIVCNALPRRKGQAQRRSVHPEPAPRWIIADSKQLYHSTTGLKYLEQGVLAALALLDRRVDHWHEAWQALDADAVEQLQAIPWHADYDVALPLAADANALSGLVEQVRVAFEKLRVKLVSLQSKTLFPAEFNQANRTFGNKSETLSRTTLALLAEALTHCHGQRVLVVCDKHGGRNQYGRLLQQQFPEALIEIHGESTAESIYYWGTEASRVEVRFCMGGESFLPTALASMASKYLRELSMRAFNEFWCGCVPNLTPTAGYPVDARRFMHAIDAKRTELGISDAVLWRSR